MHLNQARSWEGNLQERVKERERDRLEIGTSCQHFFIVTCVQGSHMCFGDNHQGKGRKGWGTGGKGEHRDNQQDEITKIRLSKERL